MAVPGQARDAALLRLGPAEVVDLGVFLALPHRVFQFAEGGVPPLGGPFAGRRVSRHVADADQFITLGEAISDELALMPARSRSGRTDAFRVTRLGDDLDRSRRDLRTPRFLLRAAALGGLAAVGMTGTAAGSWRPPRTGVTHDTPESAAPMPIGAERDVVDTIRARCEGPFSLYRCEP